MLDVQNVDPQKYSVISTLLVILGNRKLARKMAGKFVLTLLRRGAKVASNNHEFQEFVPLKKSGFVFISAC